MSALNDGRPGDEIPDFDLDRPDAGDAQVAALFRDALRPSARVAPDLRGIERRAKRRHRRHQAVASGAVSAAAALAAVLVVVSPWSVNGGGGGDGVPAGPTPTITLPEPDVTGPGVTNPDVTKASLLRTADVSGEGNFLGSSRPAVADGPAEDLSGRDLIGGVCIDNVFSVEAPGRAWQRTWRSKGGDPTHEFSLTERLAQWPGQPDRATAVLEELRAQVADCAAGPGLEGNGVTTDRTGDLELIVPYLATSVTDGTYHPYAQAFAVWGDTLVTIQVGVAATDADPQNTDGPFGNEDEATTDATTWLDNAIGRLTGETGAGTWTGLEVAAPEEDPYSTPGEGGPDPSATGTGDGQ